MDGQTERVNQCLETILRYFVHAYPKRWYRWLELAEFWYNTAHHSGSINARRSDCRNVKQVQKKRGEAVGASSAIPPSGEPSC